MSRRSLAAMTAQHSDVELAWDGYGYGVARRATDCGTALGHSGRLDGYVAEAWIVPTRDVSVVALANRGENGGGGGVLGQFLDAALCG